MQMFWPGDVALGVLLCLVDRGSDANGTLFCRATGREAMVEKRMARREAARERESSPVMDRLPGGGGDIMGGEDSFAAARARYLPWLRYIHL